MERIINIALVVLMAVLAFVAGAGMWVMITYPALENGPSPIVFQAARTVVLALGMLVVVAALFSVRKRLATIEAKLDDH